MNFETTAGELTNTSGDTAIGAWISTCAFLPVAVKSSFSRFAQVLESGIHTDAPSPAPDPPAARICSTLLDGKGVTLTATHLPSTFGLVAVHRCAIVWTGPAMLGAAVQAPTTTSTPTRSHGDTPRPEEGFECRPDIPSQWGRSRRALGCRDD